MSYMFAWKFYLPLIKDVAVKFEAVTNYILCGAVVADYDNGSTIVYTMSAISREVHRKIGRRRPSVFEDEVRFYTSYLHGDSINSRLLPIACS
jgi:hypothetical protein